MKGRKGEEVATATTQREFIQVVRIAFAGLMLAVHAPGASPAAQMFEGGVDVPTGGINEPAIAINPMNPDNIAIASNELFVGQTLRISTDGGVTFSEPIHPRSVARYRVASDPSLAFDSRGRLFWSHLGARTRDPRWGALEVFISQVDPLTGELLPGYPVNVSAAAGFPAREGHWNHKQWIAVDHHRGSPFRDRIYLVWTDEATRGGPPDDGSVVTAFSSDQGITWSEGTILFTSTEAFPVTHNAVAANGDVYLAYNDEPPGSVGDTGRVIVHRSSDGGATYPQVSTAYAPGAADITPNVQILQRLLYKSVSNTTGSRQPWLLPDPWDSSAIYVVAADDPTNLDHGAGFDDLGVFIVRSQDAGLSWTEPARVDSDPGDSHQIHPTASIDEVTGCMAVTWYDSRAGLSNPAGNFLLDLFLTSSSDGGLTFRAEVPINDSPFDPDRNAFATNQGPPPTLFIGDYNGVAVSRGVAHAAWATDWFEGLDVLFDRATVCDGPAPIDIKPGGTPNAINLSGEGVVAVALLGHEDLDVSEVDVTTLAFGPAGAAFDHSHGPHLEDVDDDGFADLVSHYQIEQTGIEFGDRESCLRGKLLDGMRFGGCDSIRTVPDMDGDSMLDVDEETIGTHTLRFDTDGDGYGDGDEVLVMGTDPLDPLDPTLAVVREHEGRRKRSR